MFYFKIKGVSPKTTKGTVYVIYRTDTTEVAKSTGVSVNPKHFNSSVGKVSSKDGLYLDKNAVIQAVTAAFQRACLFVETYVGKVTKSAIDIQMAAELEGQETNKHQRIVKESQGREAVCKGEARIGELERELKELRGRVWSNKFTLDYHLSKRERYERMIHDQQQRLAAVNVEAAEIRAYITKMQEEIGVVSSASFKDKLNEFIRIQRLNNVKESTLGNYRVILNTVEKYNKQLQLKDIDLTFFQEFQAHLVARGVTNNSIRGILSRIKGIYKYFADDEGLPLGFFSKFKMVKAGTDENVVFLYPTELAELEALPLTARVHKEVRAQFLFAVETGLRRSDYNITAANIQGNEIVLATQKTGKQVAIPLTDKARQLFSEAGQTFRLIPESQFNQTLRLICKRMESMNAASLKTFSVGNKVTQKNYEKWQRMTSHVARKTFVENAVYKGVELIAIAEWLGHVDTQMLQKHYANKKQIAKREAHKIL